MPTASPIRSAAVNSEMKGCSLNLDTIKTMMRMVSNRMTISAEPWSKKTHHLSGADRDRARCSLFSLLIVPLLERRRMRFEGHRAYSLRRAFSAF